jgi:hypothetical protein
MMSEILKKVHKINEINRRNVDVAAAEFSRKLAQAANGIPMKCELNSLCEFHRENGNVALIPVKI